MGQVLFPIWSIIGTNLEGLKWLNGVQQLFKVGSFIKQFFPFVEQEGKID